MPLTTAVAGCFGLWWSPGPQAGTPPCPPPLWDVGAGGSVAAFLFTFPVLLRSPGDLTELRGASCAVLQFQGVSLGLSWAVNSDGSTCGAGCHVLHHACVPLLRMAGSNLHACGTSVVVRGVLSGPARAALRVKFPEFLWMTIQEVVAAWGDRFPEGGSDLELALSNDIVIQGP